MTHIAHHTPESSPRHRQPARPRARSDAQPRHQTALAAAEHLLTTTADAITPGTATAELLACLTRYRAHLSALVAASKPAAN